MENINEVVLENLTSKEIEALLKRKISLEKDSAIERYYALDKEEDEILNEIENLKIRLSKVREERKEAAIFCKNADYENRYNYQLKKSPRKSKVIYYPSQSELADSMKVNKSKISNLIKKGEIKHSNGLIDMEHFDGLLIKMGVKAKPNEEQNVISEEFSSNHYNV